MDSTTQVRSHSAHSPSTHDALGTILAVGANRICVVDPGDPRYCLKYERPLHERTPAGVRQALRRRLGLWFPALGDNRSELRAYRHLRQRLGTDIDGVLAGCHGIVATTSGPALRCDCVRTFDGDGDASPAPSLYRCLFGEGAHDRRYEADALCAAVDRMEAWLLHHRVPLFDLNSGNFVVVETRSANESENLRLDLICVDLKSLVSSKEILPISRWVPALMRRKIQRRAERLRQRIRGTLAKSSPDSTST